MYQIELNYANIGRNEFVNAEGGWIYSTDDELDKPSFMFSIHHYYLVDILHDWFLENKIRYSLKCTKSRTNIIFEKESDAVLFKLTWF